MITAVIARAVADTRDALYEAQMASERGDLAGMIAGFERAKTELEQIVAAIDTEITAIRKRAAA